MCTEFIFRTLRQDELNMDLFAGFNRYQDVKRCWRKEEGRWILKDIAFVEEWGEENYRQLTEQLRRTHGAGGYVFGAFEHGRLVGFASVESERFGTKRQYVQLGEIYTSYEYRGFGIGKKLFELSKEAGKKLGASKLYISAHSSEESQKFYQKMGCVEAREYNRKLVEKEPCDCQLECRV